MSDPIPQRDELDPATESNIKTCKCGRDFNFVCFDATGCFERPRCSFCSAPSEKCFVCGEPVKALPWVEHEGRRVHTNNGTAGKWNCSLSLMMWQTFGVGRRPVGDNGHDASGAQGHTAPPHPLAGLVGGWKI